MRIRRCAVLFLEPREDTAFDLGELLQGGDGIRRQRRWQALAPHLGDEVEVNAAERELLGALSPTQWIDPDTLEAEAGTAMPRLIDLGLVVTDALPRIPPNDIEALLARRATCRNVDAQRKVPFEQFSQLLQRVFAAQAEVRVSDDLVFLKKNVPSGGGLHPMECYLIVQHVEGVAPGLYHYQSTAHALEPLAVPEGRSWDGDGLRDFVMDMVAQQHWFADAHVLVILAPRFDRTFWKYRHHAKGYRVVALEAGHLSQTLYLSATEAGLGAFITGAINEVQIEQAFGLDPIHQGALAICGFGWRAQTMETAELDPAGHVWEVADPD